MVAPIQAVDLLHPQARTVERAGDILRAGGLVAYPTDTYYGIGCDLLSKRGIERLYELKRRDRKKPLSFLCADLSEVAQYARVSNFGYRVLRALTPGAFTFVLEATRIVPELMMTRQREVGIRVPDSPLARALAVHLGHPLVTTSATDAEGNVLVDAREIKERLGRSLDLILDGGVQASEPSTVVSLLNDEVTVLRQGKGRLESP